MNTFTSLSNFKTTLDQNLIFLGNIAPQLKSFAAQASASRFAALDDQSDCDLYFSQEKVLQSCIQTLQLSLDYQLKNTDGISMPRPIYTKSPQNDDHSLILSQMVNCHQEVFLDHLPIVRPTVDLPDNYKPPYKNLIILGSLMLAPLLTYLKDSASPQWVSITLVEDSPEQFNSLLSLIDFSELIECLKCHSISFSLHIDNDPRNIQDRIYTHICQTDPTVLYGWQTLRSPVKSPALMELHSWLHAPEGICRGALGMLGFATDEINQTQQALWNALSDSNMTVLAKDIVPSDAPIVIVASGPSLDQNIDYLREHCDELNIISSGSALGTLLKNGVVPLGAVFLERGAEVYADLCDLMAEGYDLSDILAFVCSTIDPRVPSVFERTVFYHRPMSAATQLFPDDSSALLDVCGPHVTNAALEVVLRMGCRNILLVGTDFSTSNRTSPRSVDAIGSSPRDFTLPVRGNKGRTVFSEAELLHSATLFDRVIESTPGANVCQIGEGVVLPSVSSVDASDDIFLSFSCNKLSDSSLYSKMNQSSFSRDFTRNLFDDASGKVDEILDEIDASIAYSEVWSKSFVATFNPYMRRLDSSNSPSLRFLIHIICQPLFFSGMGLHDCDSHELLTTELQVARFKEGSLLLKTTFKLWLSVLSRWLGSRQFPVWDPEWLRGYYARLES